MNNWYPSPSYINHLYKPTRLTNKYILIIIYQKQNLYYLLFKRKFDFFFNLYHLLPKTISDFLTFIHSINI